MLTIQSGSEFIGFGPHAKCPKCNNKVLMKVYEEFVKTGVMYIPIVSKTGKLFVMCGTCESAWNIQKKEAIDILESGKEVTKDFLTKSDEKRRKKILERLNKLGAYDLVVYLGTV